MTSRTISRKATMGSSGFGTGHPGSSPPHLRPDDAGSARLPEHRTMSRWRATLIGIACLALIGCGSPSRATPAPAAPEAGVPWGDYSPDVKTRIDGLAASKDCTALQDEFNTADANDAATRTRTGHGNTELMTYIDGRMRAAGCY